MKRILLRGILSLTALTVMISSFAVASVKPVTPAVASQLQMSALQVKDVPEIKGVSPELLQMGVQQFLSLTPAKYKELTGKKLGIKKSLELKAAQTLLKKKMSSRAADIPKGLYIVLAILGWGFLAIGLLTDWQGNDWWINLLLSLLCLIPGIIHALVNMKKYYN